jgi:hypothetical protein
LLFGYEYNGASALPKGHPLSSLLSAHFEPVLTIPGEDSEDPMTSVFATTVEWRAGRFDQLLLAIADDRLKALWMAADSGTVFAPYDGGVDLIYPTEWQRAAARKQFEGWLSAHPEGL